MSGSGKSRILLSGEGLAEHLRKLFAKSVLLTGFSSFCMRAETSFRCGRFACLSDAENDRECRKYRSRRRWLKGFEDSLLLRGLRGISQILLSTSLSSFGSFGILYGAFSAAVWFLRDESDTLSLLISLILTVLSVLLLNSHISLSRAIRHSYLLSGFLCDFCMLSEERLGEEKQSVDRHWSALFLASAAGCLRFFYSPIYLCFFLLLFILLLLFFSVPELPSLLVLLTLPFLNVFSHASLLLAGVVGIAWLTWGSKALCGKRRARMGLIDFLILLLSASFLFGGLVGAGGKEGVTAGALTAFLLLFWFPAVSLFSQPVWRKRAFAAIRLASLVTSVWGIVQYFFTDMELLWTDTTRFSDIEGRVCGPFSNPNILAVYLLLTVPMMGVKILEKKTHVSRFFSVIAFLCGLLCLVLTWSRGAWLGMILSILFFFLFYDRTSFAWLLLSLFPLSAVLPFLPHSVTNRFLSIGSFSESSIRYRFYTWRGVLRMIAEHPWGIGLGESAFHRVYLPYAVSGTETVMHTHQLFLQVFCEIGIAGALLFLFFLFLLASMSMRGLKKRSGGDRRVLMGCICALIGALVMGVFDDIWYHRGMFCLFFTVCAALTAGAEGEEHER